MNKKLWVGAALSGLFAFQAAQAGAVFGSVQNVQFHVTSLDADPAFQPFLNFNAGYSYAAAGVTGEQLTPSPAPSTAIGWFTPVNYHSLSDKGFAVSEVQSGFEAGVRTNSLIGFGQVVGVDQFTSGHVEAPYFDEVASIVLSPRSQLTISADLFASAAIANVCAPSSAHTSNACEYADSFAALSLYAKDDRAIFDGKMVHVLLNATGTGAPMLSDTQSMQGATVSFSNTSDAAQELLFYASTQYVAYSLSNNSPVFSSPVPEPSSSLMLGLGLIGLGTVWRRKSKA